jgi:hypothetical protein
MKVTKEEIQAKIESANKSKKIGWLDTEKMQSQGIITSKPMCCTGYEPKENAFRICQQPKPRW